VKSIKLPRSNFNSQGLTPFPLFESSHSSPNLVLAGSIDFMVMVLTPSSGKGIRKLKDVGFLFTPHDLELDRLQVK
jgi:hypothetical protein